VKTLVASFGFDIDFITYRISAVKPDRVVLLALYTSREAYSKVEKSYHLISVICKSTKIDCELESIEPSNATRAVLSILEREVKNAGNVEVFLSGGPRILVITLLVASLLLPDELASKIRVVAEGEGFNCRLELDVKSLIERMRIDARSKEILNKIELIDNATFMEISRRAPDIPRSTMYRRLDELLKRGLVEKVNGYYVAKKPLKVECGD